MNIAIRILPALCILLYIIISHLPILPITLQAFIPNIAPMIIFFWALYAPQFCPIILVFFFGIAVDTLESHLLGSHSLFFIIIYFITVRLRDFISYLSLWLQLLIAIIPVTIYYIFVMANALIDQLGQEHLFFIMNKYIVTICFIVPCWFLLYHMIWFFRDVLES